MLRFSVRLGVCSPVCSDYLHRLKMMFSSISELKKRMEIGKQLRKIMMELCFM